MGGRQREGEGYYYYSLVEGFASGGLTASLKSSKVLNFVSLFVSSESTVNVFLP